MDPVLTGGVPESLPAGDLCPGPRLHSRPRPQDPGLGSPLSAPRNPGFISVVCRGWKSGGALGFCRQALLSRRQWKCDADPEDKGRTKAWPPLRREPGRSRGGPRVGKHSRTAGAAEGLWEEQHTRAGEVPGAKVPGRTVFSQCRSTGHPWAKKGAWTSPYKNLARRGHRLERQMCASKAFRRTREKHDQRAGLPEQNLGCPQMRRATRPPTR